MINGLVFVLKVLFMLMLINIVRLMVFSIGNIYFGKCFGWCISMMVSMLVIIVMIRLVGFFI